MEVPMKNVLKVMLALVLACSLTGAVFATGASDDGAKKVAGVVFQEDQFMKLLQLGYQDVAEAAGFEFYPGNTNGDAAKEAELLNTYLTQGYAGVAISPISEKASVKVLKDAATDGLLVGISNHTFMDQPFITGAFTSDNYDLGSTVGKVAAAYIAENMNGEAKIAILQYKSLLPEQSSARSSGFLDQLKDLPGIEVVTDQDAWMQDKAIAVGGDIITAYGDELDIIFAANEGGTIGATMAVKNSGQDIKVFGFDGSEQMVQLLKDDADILQAVIAQDPYNIGVKTMETVVKAAMGEDISDTQGTSFIVPGVLLERANPAGLDAFVTDLKSKMGN